MYKQRGRPDHPRNRAIAEQQRSLEQTILVSNISQQNQARQQQQLQRHYAELRKTHLLGGQRLPSRIGGPTPRDHGDGLANEDVINFDPVGDNFGDISPDLRDFLSRYGVKRVKSPRIRKRVAASNDRRRSAVLMRGVLRDPFPVQTLNFGEEVRFQRPELKYYEDFVMKKVGLTTVSVSIQNEDAPQQPPKLKPPRVTVKKRNPSQDMILELKAIEENVGKARKLASPRGLTSILSNNSTDNDSLLRQLKATEDQIHVASDQLEAIQKILQDKRLRNTFEPDAPDPESDSRPTKWKVKSTLQSKTNKRAKLAETITMLNSRLQRMQERFLKAPKMNYKTFDDLLKGIPGSNANLLRNFSGYGIDCGSDIQKLMQDNLLQQASKRTKSNSSSELLQAGSSNVGLVEKSATMGDLADYIRDDSSIVMPSSVDRCAMNLLAKKLTGTKKTVMFQDQSIVSTDSLEDIKKHNDRFGIDDTDNSIGESNVGVDIIMAPRPNPYAFRRDRYESMSDVSAAPFYEDPDAKPPSLVNPTLESSVLKSSFLRRELAGPNSNVQSKSFISDKGHQLTKPKFHKFNEAKSILSKYQQSSQSIPMKKIGLGRRILDHGTDGSNGVADGAPEHLTQLMKRYNYLMEDTLFSTHA